MYEELVKRLRYSANFSERGLTPPPNELREAADAIEAMCEMMATAHCELANVIQSYEESKPRWIPVTEEPPLKVGDDGYNGYLIYANGYYEVADYTTDKFDNSPYFHVNGEYEPGVTHFMPLPEPPKGE